MKTSFLCTLAFASLTAAHGLDLTPNPSYRLLEGTKIPVIAFDDGQRRVNWQPPAGWQLSGGGEQLNLYPQDIQLAAMQLRLLQHDAAQPPDSASAMDDLIKWAMNYLPGDASSVTLDHEAPSPFLLGGKPSRELTFNYVSVARKCSTSIALVDLDEKRSFALVITARAEDFHTVHNAGTKSMFRWNWVTKPLPGQEGYGSIETASRASAVSAGKPVLR